MVFLYFYFMKKCKGINKASKFKGCGIETKFRKYGLCLDCYKLWLLNTNEGKEQVQKSIIKSKKIRSNDLKELNKYKEQRKEENTVKSLLLQVRTYCHKYIRLRDKGKPCISCGCAYKDNFHAGHYYKAELYSSLKFNEFNINGQCVKCNIRLEGNLNGYSLNLPNRITESQFNKLNKSAELDKHSVNKWDAESLKLLRDYYRNKIKTL